MHCELGFEETTEEFTYLADADCSVAFKFPLPPRSAVFRCRTSLELRTELSRAK